MNDSQSHPMHRLLAFRRVRNFYSEPVRVNSTSTNISSSLGYQMEQSIKDLMAELKESGRDYELHLQGGSYGNRLKRWNLYVNDAHLAEIDSDYGYDCFDESGTFFKDTIRSLIELSDIQPLTEVERRELDARIKAEKIVEHMKSADRISAMTNEERKLHEAISSMFKKLKRV